MSVPFSICLCFAYMPCYEFYTYVGNLKKRREKNEGTREWDTRYMWTSRWLNQRTAFVANVAHLFAFPSPCFGALLRALCALMHLRRPNRTHSAHSNLKVSRRLCGGTLGAANVSVYENSVYVVDERLGSSPFHPKWLGCWLSLSVAGSFVCACVCHHSRMWALLESIVDVI